ncbi:spermidine synthase [Fulvivirga sp. RKSG066]|uniref:S-adenosylmethionine decarboxylase family protein n=1 Tax=Fulvivirga aurantia TaxID=2529383 RepID=UPI0012BC957A|nr:S-adenosylmethionine decarboxylase [Fulvivirga aurantia]MTI20537.1 spermidine synthase [Fulvivirga aurantia]
MLEKLDYKSLSPEIYNLRFWARDISPDLLKETFNKLLSKNEFTVLNFSEHFFPVQGYTAIWLLAESHLAIHTFPQHEWSYIELSGCNAHKTNEFKKSLYNSGLEINFETDQMSLSKPEVLSVKNKKHS